MPYCTIEEAWSKSIDPSILDINNARDPQAEFKDVYLKNSELINGNGNSIECKDKKPKKRLKKSRNLSRNYNRLPEHSGPETRLPNNEHKTVLHRNNAVQLNNNNNASISDDLPINEFNIKEYENLNDEYLNQSDDLSSNASIMKEFKSMKKEPAETEHTQHLEIINELRQENINLRRVIDELKHNKSYSSDNFMDLLTFIIAGIVLILIMENITGLMRKF